MCLTTQQLTSKIAVGILGDIAFAYLPDREHILYWQNKVAEIS